MTKPAYDNDPGLNFEAPVLYDAETAEPIRNATDDETARSRDAKKPGVEKGIIEVDGRRCYVIEWPETPAGADRRVEGPGVG
jgi:hypothetical protein